MDTWIEQQLDETEPESTDSAAAAFKIIRPSCLTSPLVFASPHSGRLYPADLMAASALDDRAIRRSEDAYVDELIIAAAQFGAPVITATYARAYIDLNRAPYELDPAMFEDELPAFAAVRTARVAAGLGSIARVVAEGQEIYRRKLTYAEAERRIDHVHRPYHGALKALLDEALSRFGAAILLDWHSMPSAAALCGGERAPDLVLGDQYGASCSREVTQSWERELEAVGYRVARNRPYAGGHITEYYGQPKRGVHALQIEINRGLYLDEARMARSGGFETLRTRLERVYSKLVGSDWSRLA